MPTIIIAEITHNPDARTIHLHKVLRCAQPCPTNYRDRGWAVIAVTALSPNEAVKVTIGSTLR